MYSAGERRCAVLRRLRSGLLTYAFSCVAGRAWDLGRRLLRLGRPLLSMTPVLVAALLPGGEVLALLFERRLFLALVVGRAAAWRGRHPQRGGQLGQGELRGSEMAAALLDVVDGHRR